MNAQFAKMITYKASQMQDAQRQEVRAALKAGARATALERYAINGPLVLRVTTPDQWRGETYDRFRHRGLSCIIPAACEQQTQAWFQRVTA